MARLDISVATEKLRLLQPFRISGYVFEAFEVVVVTLENATSPLDPWLWLLQIGGLLAFVAALASGARNLQLAFRERGRLRKVWSVLFLLSALLLAYIALRFGLLSMTAPDEDVAM